MPIKGGPEERQVDNTNIEKELERENK